MLSKRSLGFAAWLFSLAIASAAQGDEAAVFKKELEFASVDGLPLRLDLYLPAKARRTPLVVWVHGGAWRAGSKSDMPLRALISRGYAIASVDYRLSTIASFPTQIHDIKAAIRFLRAEATEYGYDASRIAIAGGSAGGHLAALVGITNGHSELEGRVGDHLQESSDVQAIVSFYGMTNLTTILAQSTPHGLKVRVPALELLLNGQPDQNPELARLASPVFHVDQRDPPLLLFHGDQDPQAPINQSHELEGAYQKVGRPAMLHVLHGAGHGGAVFFDEERMGIVDRFLQEAFRQ
jgi:acetyl esterase/lipase